MSLSESLQIYAKQPYIVLQDKRPGMALSTNEEGVTVTTIYNIPKLKKTKNSDRYIYI